MIDDETVGPAQDLGTAKIEICDLCGQPAPRLSLVRRAGLSGAAEPVEVIRVCDDCRVRVERDDVPFDEEIAAGLQLEDE